MNDVLLVIDVLNDFQHAEGERLHASFEERFDGLRKALERARADGVPVVFVNDHHGDGTTDRRRLVERAIAGRAGQRIRPLVPLDSEPLLVKTRYSAFDHTPLDLLLTELNAERLLLAGGSTEGCIVQSGIHAREHGYKVTILTAAFMTADEHREKTALTYAHSVSPGSFSTETGNPVAAGPVGRSSASVRSGRFGTVGVG
jgi:nicotinamidase-related amidase